MGDVCFFSVRRDAATGMHMVMWSYFLCYGTRPVESSTVQPRCLSGHAVLACGKEQAPSPPARRAREADQRKRGYADLPARGPCGSQIAPSGLYQGLWSALSPGIAVDGEVLDVRQSSLLTTRALDRRLCQRQAVETRRNCRRSEGLGALPPEEGHTALRMQLRYLSWSYRIFELLARLAVVSQ